MSNPSLSWLGKSGRRILGIDDAPWMPGGDDQVLVVGVVCRGDRLDGVLSTHVTRDGWDATDRLYSMLRSSKFFRQVHAIMLDGITLGGLNVVDIQRLSHRLDMPVLSIMRRRPDRAGMVLACNRLPRADMRLEILDRAGPVRAAKHVFFQVVGLDEHVAARLVDSSAVCGYIPEPVRLAHLIVGAVTTGQSGHRA